MTFKVTKLDAVKFKTAGRISQYASLVAAVKAMPDDECVVMDAPKPLSKTTNAVLNYLTKQFIREPWKVRVRQTADERIAISKVARAEDGAK